MLLDNADVNAMARYCANSYSVVVLDRTGTIRYHQYTDLTNITQRDAFIQQVDALMAP